MFHKSYMSYLPVIIIKKKINPTIISVGVEKSRKKGYWKIWREGSKLGRNSKSNIREIESHPGPGSAVPIFVHLWSSVVFIAQETFHYKNWSWLLYAKQQRGVFTGPYGCIFSVSQRKQNHWKYFRLGYLTALTSPGCRFIFVHVMNNTFRAKGLVWGILFGRNGDR